MAAGLRYGRTYQGGWNVLTAVAEAAFHAGAVAALFFIDAGARVATHRIHHQHSDIRALQATGLAWDIRLPGTGRVAQA